MSEQPGLLPDSQVFLWAASATERLPEAVPRVVADETVRVCVSVVTLWELNIKIGRGKLDTPDGPREMLGRSRVGSLAVERHHVMLVRDLPWHQRDPFDRMPIAQATAEGLTLASADRAFADYDVPVPWS